MLRAKGLLSYAEIPDPLFESELILARLLNIERYQLYVDRPQIPKKIEEQFLLLISKRANRIPLAYLLKETYFFGYKFQISKGVFVPRPETETIVSCAGRFLKDKEKRISILDICTGCGAIAIVLAQIFPFARVVATDISEKAVKTAWKNVCLHNLESRISVRHVDIIPPGLQGRFDLIVANPPYLTSDEISKAQEEVKKEPNVALDGGKNGIEIVYRILSVVPDVLSEDGFLIMEISPQQTNYFYELKDSRMSLIAVCKDISGSERVVVFRKTV
ncbi:MAG: peptide chain release factor N(5)-glutamine methyltransferase [Candidatus Omnitrophica bacterium]|nr:peptide chain release factor N(5)-glutamine methyltransferase [Candidatus Omnitrophota bacterium]MCM8827850.1 peptide chain release factor N(5)-glutamine methyltransferase [Candidatus Omnitrophota bacterium]